MKTRQDLKLKLNPLLYTDYYNFAHEKMKINTDWEVSHMYNRNKPMILFGFNWITLNILEEIITPEIIEHAAKRIGKRFNSELWYRVVDKCNGKIPLKVEALPDGMFVPEGTAFAQISNTVENFGEVVTYFEGYMMHTYFPSNCATAAYEMRMYLNKQKLSEWNVHDFGWRAQRSVEDAIWSGLGWHLSLPGSDNVVCLDFIPEDIPTGSIPASAHKTVQQFNNEMDAYVHQIEAMKRDGENMYSMVIDTFNVERFINNYVIPLSNKAYEYGAEIVFRPDSGDTKQQVLDIWRVMKQAGIDNRFRAIIGDGMTFGKIKQYNSWLKNNGVNIKRVAYGVGSGYFKQFHRDLLGFAMKTAYSNGKDRIKLARNKTSIPGRVQIYRDPDSKLIVMGAQENIDEQTKHGEKLYKIVYEYVPNTKEQVKHEQSYRDIYNNVQVQTLQQKTICYTTRLYSKIIDMKNDKKN